MSATTLIRFLQSVPPEATISTYVTKLEAHSPVGDATIDLSADDDRDCLYCGLPLAGCECLTLDEQTQLMEPDYGGAFDGFTVTSDADPGL